MDLHPKAWRWSLTLGALAWALMLLAIVGGVYAVGGL